VVDDEYNLQLDEAKAAWALRQNQLKLEAIVDDETQDEPVRAEALRELEAIYDFQKKRASATTCAAERAVRTVRMAIKRFHKRLQASTDFDGHPHPVLRPFAFHLEQYLMLPSGRYSGLHRTRARTGLAGRFTYEPPPGVVWTA
jgi:hypothetical protein